MRIVTNHNMTKQRAKSIVKRLLPDLMTRFSSSISDPTTRWQNDTVEFSGRALLFNIKGTLKITDTELILDVNGIPFFENQQTQTEMKKWFDRNWPRLEEEID